MLARSELGVWIALQLFALVQCKSTIIDLSNINWTLTSRNLPNISVPGNVPSNAHLDLLAAKKIDEPTFGDNDDRYKWIATSNFTYTSDPIKNLSAAANTRTLLDFKGIDTISEILVCNKTIGTTNNQFRRWTFDISDALKDCPEPTLVVQLSDAVSQSEVLKAHSNCTLCIGTHFEIDNRQFIRKQQNDFGWDWSPAMSPSGIWLPASIIQQSNSNNNVFVNSSLLDIYRKGQLNNIPPDQSQPWILNASLSYIGDLSPDASLEVLIQDDKNETFFESPLTNVTQQYGAITGQVQIDQKPQLWWPVGYGNQTLYNVTVNILDGSGSVIDSVNKRTGFRTIVLNQLPYTPEEVDMGIFPGTRWNFEVNGQEFYAKGSNIVPPDPFWPRVTREQMSRIFKSAIDANQNLLRIWSSSIYFPDFAFDLADEYGLLLWSELEFSDAFYQTDPEFTDNIVQETKQQVQRLNHHPSLALWCGNNEIQLALTLAETFPEFIQNFVKQLYEQLFLDSLVHAVFENTRSISYSASSETNGYISLNHTAPIPIVERYDVPHGNYVVNGSLYSSSDYYNYDVSQSYNSSAYPISRFSVEFGIIAHSPYETYVKSVAPDQLTFNSSTMIHRNRYWPDGLDYILKPFPENTTDLSLPGLGKMAQGATMYYPKPAGTNETALFKPQIYASQIFQSEFVRSQIEFYRRGSGLPQRNMGSLYWMLNDIWAAPTWASLAVDGRWKPLHYIVGRSYEPVIIAPYVNDTGFFSVWATSDQIRPVNGTASLKWYNWTGEAIDDTTAGDWTWTKPVTIGAINSTLLFNQPLTTLPPDLTNAVAFLTLSVCDHTGKEFTSTREYHPDRLSTPASIAAMRDPKLSVSYDTQNNIFNVKSEAVAGFVFLQHPEGVRGHWESNIFWMLPGQKQVRFIPDEDDDDQDHSDCDNGTNNGTTNTTSPTAWAKDVHVTSVFDLTKEY